MKHIAKDKLLLGIAVIGFSVAMVGVTIFTGQSIERIIGMAGMGVLLSLFLLADEDAYWYDRVMMLAAIVAAGAYAYDALTRGQNFKLIFYGSALGALGAYAMYKWALKVRRAAEKAAEELAEEQPVSQSADA